ncbi:MAG: hypothetical protein Q8930_10415 [Bacillota bacterium]|nr:hypothetical protein [Bacillota bacterium]
MKEYKTSLLIGILYIGALIFMPFIRSITVITLIFLALQFMFHGAFVLIGARADRVHRKFTETYYATLSALLTYAVSAGLYFISFHSLI